MAAYYTGQWAWATIGKAAAANALTSTTFAAYSNLFALAATGATAGFVGGAIISNSLEGGLVGAFQGGLFGFIGGLGLSNPQAVLAHGAVGGASSELSGGSFKSGFLSAAFGKVTSIATRGGASGYSTKKLLVATVAGGLSSRIGGGKFANGARTYAFLQIFSEAGSYYRNKVGGTPTLRPGENRPNQPFYSRDINTGQQLVNDRSMNVVGNNGPGYLCSQGTFCSKALNLIPGLNSGPARVHDYWFNVPNAPELSLINNVGLMLPAAVGYGAMLGNVVQGWQNNPMARYLISQGIDRGRD